MRKNAPFVARTDDAEYCCPGRVTVPVEYLDRYQSIPYGTTAWKKSYGRRNQIENLNGILVQQRRPGRPVVSRPRGLRPDSSGR